MSCLPGRTTFGELVPIELPPAGVGILAIAYLEPRTALVLTSTGAAFSVTAEGAVPLTGLSTGATFLDVDVGPDRRIWGPVPGRIVEIMLSDRFELFVVGAQGALERFYGAEVETLYSPPDPNAVSSDTGLAWTREGEIVAVIHDLGPVLRTQGSRLLRDTSLDGPVVVAYTDELGAMVGTDPAVSGVSGLHQKTSGEGWRLVPGTENSSSYIDLWPVGRGLLVGDDAEVLFYSDPRIRGICPPRPYSRFHIHAVAALEDGVVFGGRPSSSSGDRVTAPLAFALRLDREVPPSCTNYE